jgi:5-methylcytosine-specific restriction endonuclease McrA
MVSKPQRPGDKGVCALCGTDTGRRSKIAMQTRALWMWLARRHAEDLFARNELPRLPWDMDGTGPRTWGECHNWAQRWVTEDMTREFPAWDSTHNWEADHIIPVIEGGGGCGPEGYRTLCLVCHRSETSKLAGRRAIARRQKTEAAQLQLPA